jgi:glycosyltransferase involved in cell wall biosynthesis
VIYVVRSWPRLSQTFVLGEVLALERRGVDVELFALGRSGETLVQPEVADVRARVSYPEDAADAQRTRADHALVAAAVPQRYAATVAYARTRPWLADGYATATVRECLDRAVSVAAAVLGAAGGRAGGAPPTHVHAHFAHDPALVGLLTARLTGLPFSLTAHARDVYQVPPRALAERARAATCVVTCCRANAAHLRRVLPDASRDRVRVLHHGVRLDRFRPADRLPEHAVPQLVSVGRLVQKKGFGDLLEACALVAGTGLEFRLDLVGDGPLRPDVERRVTELGLAGTVRLVGEQDSAAVLARLRAADAFVLTPWVPPDGDRDGVPNVVVEAMACGLPVVATDAGGVADAVTHDVDGLLAPPRDVPAVAACLTRVLTDAATRRRLGAAARERAEADFDVDAAAAALVDVFGLREAPSVGARQPAGVLS